MDPGSSMLAIEDVEKYFCLTNAFQDRLATADPEQVNPEEAVRHIYYCETGYVPGVEEGATLAPLRPYLILAPDQLLYQKGSEGETTILQASGGVVCVISDNPAQGKDNKESFRDYWGWVSAMLDEIAAMHRIDDHFRFEMALAVPPWRPSLTERAADDWWESVVTFTYSTGGR